MGRKKNQQTIYKLFNMIDLTIAQDVCTIIGQIVVYLRSLCPAIDQNKLQYCACVYYYRLVKEIQRARLDVCVCKHLFGSHKKLCLNN